MYENLIKFLVLSAFLYVLAIALQTSIVYINSDPETVLNLTKAASAMLIISALSLLIGVFFVFKRRRDYYY